MSGAPDLFAHNIGILSPEAQVERVQNSKAGAPAMVPDASEPRLGWSTSTRGVGLWTSRVGSQTKT